MRRRVAGLSLFGMALIAVVTVGCGQKGPLYLPDPAPTPAPAPATSPAPAPSPAR